MSHSSAQPFPYVLGHADHELDRLDLQGALYHDLTVRAFTGAGIGPGMRVLDLGCGSGDVSRIVAAMVGPTGSVVGVDYAAESVARARARAEHAGLTNAEFHLAKIEEFTTAPDFDAVVGRLVLMHQADPAQTLRAAAGFLRADGPKITVMIETQTEILTLGGHSTPRSPLYDRIVKWKAAVVTANGIDPHAGPRLRRIFLDAGLPEPTMWMEAPAAGGPDSIIYDYMAESVRSLFPAAERLGIEGISLDEVESLADDLRREVTALDAVVLAWPLVVAHTPHGTGIAQRGPGGQRLT